MNKAKGIAIIAALALLLVVIAGTAFKTGAVGGGDKKLSDQEVGTLIADEINAELVKEGVQGQVTSVGCQKVKKTTAADSGLIAGNYFCVLGVKTSGGDACLAVAFPLVDNAPPPFKADSLVVQQVAVSYCQP